MTYSKTYSKIMEDRMKAMEWWRSLPESLKRTYRKEFKIGAITGREIARLHKLINKQHNEHKTKK